MQRTETVIVGAGQAGLALSRYLVDAGHDHVLLERGRTGERWRSERWDSLVLLSPNWLNQLPGGPAHDDLDGFLGREAFVQYLDDYARSFGAPVEEGVTVLAVEQAGKEFRVVTDRGTWLAANVVVATGDAADPRVPAQAAALPAGLLQLHASRYRSPNDLPGGGVLVVGAGPSGHQIALELARAGRHVVLSVGRHARMLRRYRDRDIWAWLDTIGVLDDKIDEVPAPDASRRSPSLALTGGNGGEEIDLGRLADAGVAVAGRLRGFDDHRAMFADDLEIQVADSDRRLRRLLHRIDRHADTFDPHVAGELPLVPELTLPAGPAGIDLRDARIETVIWATGYRRSYPWLRVPVLDGAGEIVHQRGITSVAGVFALGLRFQHRRKSHFIGGVGADAAFLAEVLEGNVETSRAA